MADANSTVVYKDIPGFPGYRAGEDGSIWSCRHRRSERAPVTWKRLAGLSDREGYLFIMLRNNGRSYPRKIHRLVLETFVGPCPTGMESRHLDGVASNNRLTNLRWGTHTENQEDKAKHGTNAKGEQIKNSKLTAAVVLAIRAEAASATPGMHRSLARKYGVSSSLIYQIIDRRIWKHI